MKAPSPATLLLRRVRRWAGLGAALPLVAWAQPLEAARALPGVFCAGEMLDWEAPTGGYLLTACFASGQKAGKAVLRWLQAI